MLVPAHAALERRTGISQVEDLAHHRPQLPGVGERGDLEQLLAAGLDDEVEGDDLPTGRGVRRRLLGDRDQPPARAQHGGRPREEIAADGVEDEIDGIDDVLKRVVVWSTTWSAPSSRARSKFRVDAVAITDAPRPRASCTARWPTPPAAPWIRTRWPDASSPWSKSACQALSAARGSAAAWTWSSERGFGAMNTVGRTTKSAAAPSRSKPVSAYTASPTVTSPTSGPVVATTPESS